MPHTPPRDLPSAPFCEDPSRPPRHGILPLLLPLPCAEWAFAFIVGTAPSETIWDLPLPATSGSATSSIRPDLGIPNHALPPPPLRLGDGENASGQWQRTTCFWPSLLHPRRIARYFSRFHRQKVEAVVAFGDWSAGKRNTVQGGCIGTVLMQIMGDARDTLVSSSGSPPRRARLSSLAVAYRNPVPILSWARLEATVTKYSDAEWTTTAKILDGCGKLLVEGEGVWVARHDLGKAISIAERIASADTLAWDSDLMPLERISTKLPEIPRRVRNLMDATIAANVPPLHNPPSASQSSPLSSAVLHFGGLNPTVAPHEHHVDIYFITENLWGVDKITRGAWAALRWDETHNEGTDVSTTAVAHPPRIEFHGEYELGTGGFGAGDPATARLGRNGCVEMDLHAGFLFTLADTCYSNMLGTLYGEGPTGTFTCTFPHTHTVTAHPTGADFSRSGSGSWISLTSFLERQEKRKAFLGGRIMDAEGRDIVRGQGVWIVLNGQEGRAGVDNESGLSCGREYATVIRKGEVVQKHTVTESAKI